MPRRRNTGAYNWIMIVCDKSNKNKSAGFHIDDVAYPSEYEAINSGKRFLNRNKLFSEGLSIKIFAVEA